MKYLIPFFLTLVALGFIANNRPYEVEYLKSGGTYETEMVYSNGPPTEPHVVDGTYYFPRRATLDVGLLSGLVLGAIGAGAVAALLVARGGQRPTR